MARMQQMIETLTQEEAYGEATFLIQGEIPVPSLEG